MDLDIDQLFYSSLDTNSSLVSSSALYMYRLQRHIEFGLSIRHVGLPPPSFFLRRRLGVIPQRHIARVALTALITLGLEFQDAALRRGVGA